MLSAPTEGGRKRGTFVRFSAAYKNPILTVGGHLTKEKHAYVAALITIAAIVCLQLKKQNHHHHDGPIQSG